MPAGFFKLKIDKINRETEDAVSIRFLVPPPLKSKFIYKAGQYLTFHAVINGEDIRRSYSVCESPYEDAMPTIAIKRVEGGRMSNYMNDSLQVGDLMEVMPPMGKFVIEPSAESTNNYVLFAGGSGVTPLKSILKTILLKEPLSTISLAYANRNKESVIFRKELEELAKENADRFKLIHIWEEGDVGSEHFNGRIDASIINKITGNNPENHIYFMCGPAPLMDVVKTTLESNQVPNDQINIEYFAAVERAVDAAAAESAAGDCSEPIEEQTVKVILYGDAEDITVKVGQTILEAAQEADIDPPYSCTVGVCTTCRAKVKSGKVKMVEREGLSDAEIEDGYILTCQSHPCTSDVELEFD